MVETSHLHIDEHGPDQCAFFFDYGNDFGCVLRMRGQESITILVEINDDDRWEEHEKRVHYTFNDALLWIVKWRYYT